LAHVAGDGVAYLRATPAGVDVTHPRVHIDLDQGKLLGGHAGDAVLELQPVRVQRRRLLDHSHERCRDAGGEPSALTRAPELPDGERRGCLLGLVKVLTTALARAQSTGEVTTSAAPEAQAQLLLLLFQGSALVGRAQPDRNGLAAGVDAAIDALRSH
jgi:hypothetical protein